MKEIRLLNAEDIDVKVKQVTEKGAVVLLYKNARVDMNILDETFGAENWECDYKEIKGNLYCGIGVNFNDEYHSLTWKWDCGIESREDEGNEKKGEASDAFKRAGFKWGIGRELYTAPFTFITVPTTQKNGKYELENKYERFKVKEIGYTDRVISHLIIVDSKGNIVYNMTSKSSPQPTKPQTMINNSPETQKPVETQINEKKQDIDLETAKNTVLNFGKHKGKPLCMVDTDYLEWLVDNSTNEFIKKCAKLVITWERDEIEPQRPEDENDGLPF